VLGRSVTLSGTPVTIVGVMPADFYFPSRTTEFWQPIVFDPANATRGGHFIGVLARLKPDVTVAQAAAEMRSIAARLAVEYPTSNADESAEVVLLRENIVGRIRAALLTLFAAVGVVILIACANVANLLLVRASVRGKEIAIRAALGAGRRRIVRQMLVESLMLSLAGGALGLLMAYAAMDPIRNLSAGSIPRVDDIGIDPAVLLFALVVSLVTGVLFGLAPAWQTSRTGIGENLKEGGRSSSTAAGRSVRSGLLVAEVAMSIVLLVGATLLLRSFARLTGVDPGFDPHGVLAFRIALPSTTYTADSNRIAFYDRLLTDLKQQPGVTDAGIVQTMPMRGDYVLSFAIQGRPPAQPGHEPSANYRGISPGYFRALGIPVMRGRVFTEHDIERAPLVAVVDQAFVRRYFPDEDPIGQGIDIGNGTDGFVRIVGVVGNVHYMGLDVTAGPTMYVPFRQDVFSSMWVLARTVADPAAFSPTARRIVRAIDPALPAFSMAPLTDVVSDSVAQQRFSMLLVVAFALTALFLATVGLYGVVAYTVSQRTQEIGVRVAMGAQRSQVLGMIVGGGMRLTLLGLAIGFVASVAISRVTESLLFDMTPFDPFSYAVTAAALLVIAALACYVPARRALRVDPIVALRA
jgi:putative ABC transport system permease protein